ncbi:MAG: VCBS repeat-containing protein [Fuerstiella sp.]
MPADRKTVSFLTIAALLFVLTAAFVFRRPWNQWAGAPASDSVSRQNRDSRKVNANETSNAESTIRFAVVPPARTGINFEYYGSPSNEHYLTEQNGGGVAIIDSDGDGNSDLFFVNGSHFRNPAKSQSASNQIFRGDGDFHFHDVTTDAGLQAYNFGHGCAVGDYNNDGFSDLFVACYGPNRLWCNNGDGTYSEVTNTAGVGHTGFGTSAAFADLNGDGNPELFVVNYVNWVPDNKPRDRVETPMDFDGQDDLLYRNVGNGQFEEVGKHAGMVIDDDGKGLAVAIADFDGDHQLDVYVANDTRRNFMFSNTGDLTFNEVGVGIGAAVSQDGSIGSSMGIAVSDYNLDGRPDLFVTNFAHELVDVLMNAGPAGFIATNTELGVDVVSRPVLNFGIVSTDFDLDLWPDLFFANGHLWDERPAGGEFHMLPSLLKNDRGQRFFDVSGTAGEYFSKRWLGRATAMGDLDNDGDTDLVVSHLLAPPAILENTSAGQGKSQRVMFIGTTSCRQPLGCEVNVQLTSDRSLTMIIPSGGSFQASHDPVLVVPTGNTGAIEWISICWSNGTVEVWKDLSVEDTIRLVQGTGTTSVD